MRCGNDEDECGPPQRGKPKSISAHDQGLWPATWRKG